VTLFPYVVGQEPLEIRSILVTSKVVPIQFAHADPAQIAALAARVKADFPKLDVLINNAGILLYKNLKSQTWLRFLRKEANLVWALVRRKIRISGSPKLLLAFGRCFPS
jgi:NAD(P)-dependent dehydrogenase (short-subunit alcohol dehydrogenase family)